MMERFNYKNLKAVAKEDARILFWLECESWGRKRDEAEELERLQEQMESDRSEHG